jgi:putative peptidoglycan lipid II flippase
MIEQANTSVERSERPSGTRSGTKSGNDTQLSNEARQVTRAAILISVGNIASRGLGLVREMVKSYLFGAGGAVSAFDVASQVPTMLYDQLVGGMLSSSLVPVFSDYADVDDKEELWTLFSHVLTFAALVLSGIVLLIEAAAPWIARMLGQALPPAYLTMATEMVRLTAPAVFFLNIAGLISATLFAMRRFALPAFNAAVYNLTLIVVMVMLGRGELGARAMAVGVFVATAVQTAFQIPGLYGIKLRWRSPFPLHPALVQIGRLYLPIGLGLLVDQFAVGLSFNIASRTGPSGIARMKYAATLIQFPLGLVVTAVSVAILPTLSRYATEADEEAFRATLAQGLRLVLILVLPAAVGLLMMAEPLVALILQRGQFQPIDTQATSVALRFSVLGLIFAALDQPLIYAFYARKDTWTPTLVGVGTVCFYIVLAVLPPLLGEPTLWALVLANSLKLTSHALLMLYLFTRRIGGLKPYRLGHTVLIASGAAVAMALPIYSLSTGLEPLVPSGSLGILIRVGVAGGLGGIFYLGLLSLMDVKEIKLMQEALRIRKAPKTSPTEIIQV